MDENAPTRKPRKVYSKDNKILLLLKDGSAKLQQIISLSGLGRKTVDKTLRKLIGYDLVERLQWGYYGLTPRGKEHVSQLRVMVEPVFTHKDVVQLIAKFPTEAHQAFLRLLICGVAAKRLLFDYFDDYFPAFLAYGRTRTLKTFMAKIVCKLFGLDPEVHIRLLDNALPKEVGVRRIRAGGQTRYAVVGSKYFDMEFVCFDEWNHADRKLRDAVLSYADGRTRLSVEDGQIVNRVCCMITSNTDRKGIEIPDSYVRRSVMLDTDPLASELKDAGRIAREISNAPIPRIELDGRQVQVTKLEDEDYELLESLLKSGVREDAWGVSVDVYPVEILTLGHLALSDSDDVKASIYGVAYDRLAVLETLGATVEGWRDPLLRAWAAWQGEESSEIAQRRVEAEQKERETRKELEEREQEIEEGGTEDLKGRLEFVRARAELVAEVERLSEGLPQEEGWRFATKPVWDMLDVFIREVEGQEDGTLEELEEYRRIFDREIRPKLTHVCTLYVVKEGQRKEAEWQWQEEQERLQERKEDLIGKLEGHLARLMPYRKKKEQEEARGEKTEIRFLISKIKKAKDREELEQVGGELSLDITIMAKEFRVNELVSSWKERRVQELADEKKAEEEERQRAKEEIIAKEIKDLWDYLENTPVPNRDLTPLLVRIGCISIEGDEITGIDGKRYDSCDFDFSSISETLAAHKGRDLVHDVFRNVIRNMKQDVVSLVDRRKKALKFVDS